MRFPAYLVAAFASLAAVVYAQDIDTNDVPNECLGICTPAVNLTQVCDRAHDDDDAGYIDCVCKAHGSRSVLPLCEACIAHFDSTDGHDNDVNDLISSCSFTTTSWDSAAAASVASSATASSGTSSPNSASATTTTTTQTSKTTITGTSGSTSSTSTLTLTRTQTSTSTSAAASSTGAASQVGTHEAYGLLALGLGILHLV